MATQEGISHQVACRISRSTYMKIKRLIEAGLFLNFSDFARKAIENELDRLGETEILSVREASVEEARRLIEEYLDQHRGPVYPSDIAAHYGLELEHGFELKKAIESYREGSVTLSRAAEIAGVSIWEMIDILTQKRILSQYNVEDLEEDLKALSNEKIR